MVQRAPVPGAAEAASASTQKPCHTTTMNSRSLLPFIVFAILIFFAFGASLWHGFAPLDDAFLVYGNLAIRGINPENLWIIFTTYDPELYIPLSLFTYQINYLISGLDPWSYHLLNLILHTVNAGLVFTLVRKIIHDTRIALLCGALFAVHPITVQPVVWIASRKDLLMTCFSLCTYLCYLQYREGSYRAYCCSIVLFLLALLSKVSVFTLPVILLLHDVCIEKRSWNKHMLLDKLPYLGLSVVFGIVATGGKSQYLGDNRALSVLYLSGKSVLLYVQNILWPLRLSILYPFTGSLHFMNPQLFIANCIALIGGIGVCWYSWKRASHIAFGLLFFLLIIGPTLLNVRIHADPTLGADRYAYFALVGILIAMGIGMHKSDKYQQWYLSIGSCVVILCTILSYQYTQVWSSSIKLYKHELAMHPQSITARVSFAKILRESGEYLQAFDLLKEGLEYRDHPQLHHAAGLVYAATQNINDAIEQFTIAHDMDPSNPEPLFALGSLYEQISREALAIPLYQQALELDPSYVVAQAHLGNLLRTQGDLRAAETHLLQALSWNPNSVETHYYLALLYLDQQNTVAAKTELTTVLKLDPYHGEAQERLALLSK